MNVYVCDIETDSLNANKIHTLSYKKLGREEVRTLTSYHKMKKFLLQENLILIMHNGIRFDIPTLERLLEIKIKAFVIDTLPVSWYLFPNRNKHGLEEWGEEVGVAKVKVEDSQWEIGNSDLMKERCEQDVEINEAIWKIFSEFLQELYEVEEDQVFSLPILRYLMFKLDVARMQEEEGWHIDVDKVKANIDIITPIVEEKKQALEACMPPIVKWKIVNAPQRPYKKDGSLSVAGATWVALLESRGLPASYRGSVRVESSSSPPNANSPEQVKDWLFSLGWKPTTFKETKSKTTGIVKKIPQIKKERDDGLCESVLALIEDNPEVEHLHMLSIAKHRLGLLKGFLRDERDGKVKARISGLTNTLRYKHTEIVNLPKVDKAFGEYVRSCLVAPEGELLCGTDMVAIEDLTKRHWIYPYDPQYVEDMSVPGYDPHLYLAVKSEALTEQQSEDHKAGIASYKTIRNEYKTTNYSSTYGIGAAKLAGDLKCSLDKAKKLLKDFWEVNWSIREVEKHCLVKEVKGCKWLFNPLSEFWYSLRAEKDRFSTLNQGTAAYCFDKLLFILIRKKVKIIANFHDEWINRLKEDEVDKMTQIANDSIDELNDKLKLNVKLAIDIHFGKCYSEIH